MDRFEDGFITGYEQGLQEGERRMLAAWRRSVPESPNLAGCLVFAEIEELPRRALISELLKREAATSQLEGC